MHPVLCAYTIPLIVGLLAVAIWGLGDGAVEMLAYRRQAILDGDWWRLVSGHWVHSGWRHLGLNLAGLALVWLLFGDALRAGCWLLLMAIVVLGQSLLLLAFYPDVLWFEGLSGLLHGLLAASALLSLRRTPLLSGLTLAALLIKLGLEAWQGASPAMAVWLDGPVLVESHWCGAIAGVAGSAIVLGSGYRTSSGIPALSASDRNRERLPSERQ